MSDVLKGRTRDILQKSFDAARLRARFPPPRTPAPSDNRLLELAEVLCGRVYSERTVSIDTSAGRTVRKYYERFGMNPGLAATRCFVWRNKCRVAVMVGRHR